MEGQEDSGRAGVRFIEMVGAAAVAPSERFEGGWIVAIAIMIACSAATVTGFVCQKKAVQRPARWTFGDMVFTPLWMLGFVLTVVLPAPCQVLAYSLAPMSLTAPLGGISVALNVVVAPLLLGERWQRWPDWPATALITSGTVLTTACGSHTEVGRDSGQLEGLFEAPLFIVSLASLVLSGAVCMSYMSWRRADIELSALARPENPKICDVFLPAYVSAASGCIANIFLKLVGELLATHGEAWQIAVCLPFLATLGGTQLNYLNKGLRLYMQTVFFPIYSALLMLSNTVFGMIFFKEYEALLSDGRWVGFAGGMSLVVAGVGMFTQRRSETELAMALTPESEEVSTTASSLSAEMWQRGGVRCIQGIIAPSSRTHVLQEEANSWASIVD